MIDTDKYEGHSKGDNELGWRINNNFVSNDKCPNDRYIAYVQGDKVMEFSDADANLIADAPLLLAEVKRMRAVFDSHGECHLCGFRLDEHYPDHELPCDHVEEGLE